MTERTEIIVARCIRRVLGTLPENAVVRDPDGSVCNGLEYLIPEILRATFEYWKHESLDGLYAARLPKRGPNAAEIVGKTSSG